MTVYLKGLSVPVILNITSGETDTTTLSQEIDSRLDLRIPRRGPASPVVSIPSEKIALHDATLQAFLDGVPPDDPAIRRLKFSGNVPDTTIWQHGDDLLVRSRAMLRDEFEQTLASADGTRLWKLPVTPLTHLLREWSVRSRHPGTGVNHERRTRTGHSRKIRQKAVSPAGYGGVIIIGGGYLLLTWLSPENAASLSSVNINSTTSGGGRNVMETQHYRDLLRADNERGAAEALRNNETFIASLPRGLDTDTGNDQKRDNPPDDQSGTSGQNASPSGRSDCPGKTA